jgi:hypothetical protein
MIISDDKLNRRSNPRLARPPARKGEKSRLRGLHATLRRETDFFICIRRNPLKSPDSDE